jgi:hypothetical protein
MLHLAVHFNFEHILFRISGGSIEIIVTVQSVFFLDIEPHSDWQFAAIKISKGQRPTAMTWDSIKIPFICESRIITG